MMERERKHIEWGGKWEFGHCQENVFLLCDEDYGITYSSFFYHI